MLAGFLAAQLWINYIIMRLEYSTQDLEWKKKLILTCNWKIKDLVESTYFTLNVFSIGASDSTSPSTANFEAQYTPLNGTPLIPPVLVTQIMWPSLLDFIHGRTALVSRNTPKKLVSKTLLATSIVWVSKGPSKPTPALLTRKDKINTACISFLK